MAGNDEGGGDVGSIESTECIFMVVCNCWNDESIYLLEVKHVLK